jgi:5-methylcytosine-specific restriction endonuclease McrA
MLDDNMIESKYSKRKPINNSIRKLVVEVYDGKCAECECKYQHIHHIDHNPNNNKIDNLVPLCLNCHIMKHPEKELEMRKWSETKVINKFLKRFF